MIDILAKTIFTTYGKDNFDASKFKPVKNRQFFVKPYGGLYSSSYEYERTWFDWCMDENFNTESLSTFFNFVLKDDTKILTITNRNILKELPKAPQKYNYQCDTFVYLDFEKLAEEYDCIEVLISYDLELYDLLYGLVGIVILCLL